MSTNLDSFVRSTTFVGRDEDIAAIHTSLANPGCRLLSLLGGGGIGKTRLAVQSARPLVDDFTDGVWFVSLQSANDMDAAFDAIADVLDLNLSGHQPRLEPLTAVLDSKHLLLILDNFEHLVEAAPHLTTLLQAAPHIKLMVTSRERLNIPHEWVYMLTGLPVPESHKIELAQRYPSVQLFVERATQVRPAFSLRDERSAVIRICQLLEGVPLALELAATWVKMLRCSEILAEIQQSMTFLRSQMRQPSARHQSMEAVFLQTWKRLSEDERHAFTRLSVFRGGFRREAAHHVTGTPLDVLLSLLDKCLIRRDEQGRFHLHELLRQFAEARLEEKTAVQRTHCDYYTRFLAEHKRGTTEDYQLEATQTIERELENIRAAWATAVEHHLTDALWRAAAPHFFFCQIQSRFSESATASEQAAAIFEAGGETDRLAQVQVYWGWMLIRLGQFGDAREVLEGSLAHFELQELRPLYGMGTHPLSALIILNGIQGHYATAIEQGERLKTESTAHDDIHNEAFACYGLTSAYLHQGDYQQARYHARQAVQCCEQSGNRWFMAYCLIEWGNVAKAAENFTEAQTHYKASLRIRESFNDPEGIAVVSSHLADIALHHHKYDDARYLYERSLSRYRDLNDKGGRARAYHGLARVAKALGEVQRACGHFRVALRIAMDIHYLPLLIAILLDVADLLLHTAHRQLAIDVLATIAHHPGSTAQHRTRAAHSLANINGASPGNSPEIATLAAILHAELEDIALPDAEQQPLLDPLTPRELEVLDHLAAGLSNTDIAAELVISVGTVKAHCSRIYSKLEVANRTEAAIKAQQLGLLE